MTDADYAEGSNQTLSEFGQHRVCEFAREKAKQIDERNTEWRYQAEILLGLLQLGFGISVILGALAVLYSLIVGSPVLELVGQTVLSLVGAIAAKKAGEAVANPDIKVGA